MLQFTTSYQQQITRTDTFRKRLKRLNLLEEMTATSQLTNGEKAEVKEFMAADQNRLTQLPGETLAELASSGALELIYAHLLSLRNLAEPLELRTGQLNGQESPTKKGGGGSSTPWAPVAQTLDGKQ